MLIFLITNVTNLNATNVNRELDYTVKEYTITFNLKNSGTFSSKAIYFNSDNKLFVSVVELFNQLKVTCKPNVDNSIITGYILDPQNTYTVNNNNKSVKIGNITYFIGDSLMKYNNTLFMESSQYEKIFNIAMIVNMKDHSVDINPGFELSIIKEKEKEGTFYNNELNASYDEFDLSIILNNNNVFSSAALYFNESNKLFVSITSLFNYLKFSIKTSPVNTTLSGFTINENYPFVIDYLNKTVSFANVNYSIGNGLIKHNNVLFMESSQFGKIFNIDLKFDYKKLSATINSDIELPLTINTEKVISPLGEKADYNEFAVTFSLNDYGRLSSDALFFNRDNKLFISVTELFNYLKIPCNPEVGNDIFTGYINKEDNKYAFDYINKTVRMGNVEYFIGDSLMKYKNTMFMELSQYGKIFNIKLEFDKKSNTVLINPIVELNLPKKQANKNLPFGNEVDYIYEELDVDFILNGIGHFSSVALYYSLDNKLFIPIAEFLNYLKIQCNPEVINDGLNGFIKNEENIYHINNINKTAIVGNHNFILGDSLMKYKNTLYLESSQFGKIFNIYLQFDTRKLAVNITPGFELPLSKLLKIQSMQVNNNGNIGNDFIADTTINAKRNSFGLGTFDWSYSTAQLNGNSVSNTIMLGFGAELMGGSLNLKLDQTDQYKFDLKHQQYSWSKKNTENRFVKEINIGKINNNIIANYYYLMNGIQITNISPGSRKASGYYTVNGTAEPGWKVHLYVNNQLVEIREPDASGKYEFKVPLKYGKTNVETRLYGPAGEEKKEQKNINIPFNFVPAGKFEYSLSSGMFSDKKFSRYMHSENSFGISNHLTIGAGADYISGLGKNEFIPFGSANIQPFSMLNLNGMYVHNVYTKGNMSFKLKNAFVDVKYTLVNESQTAVSLSFKDEKCIQVLTPYTFFKKAGSFKFDYVGKTYTNFNFNNYNISNSVNVYKIKTQLNVGINQIKPLKDSESIMKGSIYVNSGLNVSYKLLDKYYMGHGIQYNISEKKPVMFTTAISRTVNKKFSYSMSFYKSFISKSVGVSFSVVYSFDIMKVSTGASMYNQNVLTYESVGGGLYFGGNDNITQATNTSNVGQSALLLYPFLDYNNNGKFDEGEKMFKLSKISFTGGRVINNENDTIIKVLGLSPFTSYTLSLSDNNFESISLSFSKKNYKITVEPNQFKRIDIPITVKAEASGKVYSYDEAGVLIGQDRITVIIYDINGKEITRMLTEGDGYFSYLGLCPGKYIAKLDPAQLNNLGLVADPPEMKFDVKPTTDGDIIDNVFFVIGKPQIQEEEIVPTEY